MGNWFIEYTAAARVSFAAVRYAGRSLLFEYRPESDVDGIIIVGTHPGENPNELKRMGVPIVLGQLCNGQRFSYIGIEDKEGARMATRYLIGKGHRRIAFISGPFVKTALT